MASRFRLTEAMADKIIRLRDLENLDWIIIGQRMGMRSDSASKAYQKRKTELADQDETTKYGHET